MVSRVKEEVTMEQDEERREKSVIMDLKTT
jgi:hypothetical protein